MHAKDLQDRAFILLVKMRNYVALLHLEIDYSEN